VRWSFDNLFVSSILEVVNAEDEIWLVESGMKNRLHIGAQKRQNKVPTLQDEPEFLSFELRR